MSEGAAIAPVHARWLALTGNWQLESGNLDIKLLTDVEKASIGERQPLPERYLRLSDDEMDERIATAKKT